MSEDKDMRREALQNILSHKYFMHGTCWECGTEFGYCTNKNLKGIRQCLCSDECYKKVQKKKRERNKEQHHFEVYTDGQYYYLKDQELYYEKRDLNGKSWQLKSTQEAWIASDPIFLKDYKQSILSKTATIPTNAIKIIDKVAPYLYDKAHPFTAWKDLKEIRSK